MGKEAHNATEAAIVQLRNAIKPNEVNSQPFEVRNDNITPNILGKEAHNTTGVANVTLDYQHFNVGKNITSK